MHPNDCQKSSLFSFSLARYRGSTAPNGFSLIELALCLLVAGLMMGGILKGRELMMQARLQKTAAHIMAYQMAYHTFKSFYNAMPGDYAGASLAWGNGVLNGNQNGHLEGHGRQADAEAGFFWNHLACADLITLQPAASSPGGVLQYGQGLPVTPLGGGFTVEEGPEGLAGVWLILGSESGDRGTGGLLTPAQAAFLDRHLDTGLPLTGRVRGREGTGIAAGHCVAAGAYNLRIKDKTCVLYVQLD